MIGIPPLLIGRRVVKRVSASLLGLLMAWLALANVAAAAATPPPRACHVYDYNSEHMCAPSADSATERGPPAAHDPHTAYTAIDRWSHGASRRTRTTTTPIAFAYDHTAACAGCQRGAEDRRTRAGDFVFPFVGFAVAGCRKRRSSARRPDRHGGRDGRHRDSQRDARQARGWRYDVIGHGTPSSVSGMSANELWRDSSEAAVGRPEHSSALLQHGLPDWNVRSGPGERTRRCCPSAEQRHHREWSGRDHL